MIITLSDYDTCLARRLLRVYDPPDPPAYFQKVVWPCYEANKKEVLTECPNIGNIQLFVNFILILSARWRFKIVCLQTKLASLAIRKMVISTEF